MNAIRETVRRIAAIAAPAAALSLSFGTLSPVPAIAASCDALASVRSTRRRSTPPSPIAAGDYAPAGGAEIAGLPAFCRVHGVITPVEDLKVGFEVWLPDTDWNGNIEMLGNGGYSSAISYPAMADQLKRGYAVVATDTGHKGDDPDFAAGRPEAIVDWASRAVHVSIDAAKSVVSAFYGQAARHACFWGCSTGGQQALTEAQRYPKDFDGIIAGDPGNNRTHLNAGFLWQFVKNHRSGDLSVIVPPEKLALITDAVVKECRGEDGGAASDEFLTDPEACGFQPVRTAVHGRGRSGVPHPRARSMPWSRCTAARTIRKRATRSITAGRRAAKTRGAWSRPCPGGASIGPIRRTPIARRVSTSGGSGRFRTPTGTGGPSTSTLG